MDRVLSLREFLRIVARYGVRVDRKRGKGSHIMLSRTTSNGVRTYPIPTHGKNIQALYVKGCRKRFELTPEHGVTDEEFYA